MAEAPELRLAIGPSDPDLFLVVPMHKGKTLKRGTLRSILREAEITIEDFLAALGR